MGIKIKHRSTSKILLSLDKKDLRDADLRGATVRDADLQNADLQKANLRGADLREANLRWANLREANLRWANLRGANLQKANLRGAKLWWANLQGADLSYFQICPAEGSFYAYKVTTKGIIKIKIPAKAKRTSSLVGRKCRAEFIQVISGKGIGGKDIYSHSILYDKGLTIYPDKYDDDIRVECTNGIHFFMTKEEAEEWV